jgi:predicted metal-dependent HD superfamily phosphohydrolase
MNALSALKKKWFQLSGKYSDDIEIQHSIFEKIISSYSNKSRHYHDLSHLQKMFETILTFESILLNPDCVHFAIWFHDIIYDAKRSDNEERSAEYAKNELRKLNTDATLINSVSDLILHTKTHTIINKNESIDMQFFLDTDLVILGGNENEYIKYLEGVRKEYDHVPAILYKMGRKKILKKFLEQKYIYRTNEFRVRFEKKARENIQFEIDQL